MISAIKIKKLFGLYNYNLEFKNPRDGEVTILTGPNGYGKTTILRIIDWVYQQRFLEFYFLPFDSITIDFISKISGVKSSLNITKVISVNEDESDNKSEEVKNIIFKFFRNGEEKDKLELPKPFISNLIKTTRTYYQLNEFGPTMTDKDYLLSSRAMNDPQMRAKGSNLRMFLQEESAYFVPAQRIFLNKPIDDNESTEMDAILKELIAEYDASLKSFATYSQSVDSTFVKRLLDDEKIQVFTNEKYANKVKKIKHLTDEFSKVGLSSTVEMPDNFPNNYQKTLSLHLTDSMSKLERLYPLWIKISTLLSCLNRKGLADKEINANPKKGLYCILDKKKEIELSGLSSGERNIIVLYYRMIFRKENNSILLIDEPENSLHPAWLDTMMDDIMEMAKNLRIQIIVATHSPSFIGKYWKHSTDLYRIVEK